MWHKDEPDVGNKAGSALLLAALLPKVYGNPALAPLKILGYPPPERYTRISDKKPRSGCHACADNRRMNVWEAILRKWEGVERLSDVRDLLLKCLIDMLKALHMSVDKDGTKLAWQVARPAIVYSSSYEPVGHRERRSGHMN